MATDIDKFLKDNPTRGEFQPYFFHSREGDAITIHFAPDPDYSKRLNDHVTLLLSIETDDIVGCRIKGVSGILEDLPNYIHVDHGGMSLSVVLLPYLGVNADEELRKVLGELAKKSANLRLEECGTGNG